MSRLDHSGPQLRQLRVPIGGVGAGNLLVGGRGDLQHFEICNRPNRVRKPVYTFFAVRADTGEGAPLTKILERTPLPPFDDVSQRSAHGLPRFAEVVFTNRYPLPQWRFLDERMPLEITMEAVNPFVPLDLAASSLPMAAFYWDMRNRGDRSCDVALTLCLENPVQADSIRNAIHRDGSTEGLRFESVAGASPNNQGALLAATPVASATLQTHGYPGRWRDDLHLFWEEFRDHGTIESTEEPWTAHADPLQYNEASPRNGAILVRFRLEPGESRRIPFYLCWHFPRRTFTAGEVFGIAEATEQVFENDYAARFDTAEAVLAYYREHEDVLYGRTRAFADQIHHSSLPEPVREALVTQAASLKTPLVQIARGGQVHGFEGVNPTGGCCPGSCTHVWNFAQAAASLFPEMERSMREIEFLLNTTDNGFQAHRSVFPLGDYRFDGPAAADGQLGAIVRVYREWRYSGDTAWLEKLWPRVKRAIRFAWDGPGQVADPRFRHQERQDPWDPDRTGILTGRQHNTYDISFFGPNSMTSSIYLAALRAGAGMAEAMGDADFAAECRRIADAGAERFEATLWNGRYYRQIIEQDPEAGADIEYELTPVRGSGEPIPKYQYGTGCLADQLLGQYLAFNAGLGYLLDREHVSRALGEIHRHNFIRDLSRYDNAQRVYGLGDEAGVVLCAWPDGDRPRLPFVYADEIWTGVEFQVAASLIYAGQVDAGLEVVAAIQDRHDGFKRNPFEHDESGVHYARAMASWSLLPALSGIAWDGVAQRLAFSPQLHGEDGVFSTFWSTGTAWGQYTLGPREALLEVTFGRLELRSFAPGRRVDPRDLPAGANPEGDSRVEFPDSHVINAGGALRVALT